MKVLRTVLTALTVSLVLFSAPLMGQEEEQQEREKKTDFVDDSRKMEVTTSIVLQGHSLNYIFIPDGKDSVLNKDNSRLSFQCRFSLYFSRYKTFGVEGVFGYTHATGTYQQPADTSDPDNPIYFPIETLDHNVFHYGGNLIYNFGYLDVVPFLTFGGGMNQIKPAEGSSYPLDDSYYNLSLGFGVKYFLKEWFGVRGEGSYYYYFLSGDEIEVNGSALRFHVGAVFTF